MKELGEFLKKAREERGISLKEIQDRTKIRTRYLEAIEKGEFQIIPGEVYLKGFLRSYAESIGLDGFEIVEEYKRRTSELERDEESRTIAEMVAPNRRKSPWLWAIIVITLLGGLLWWWRR